MPAHYVTTILAGFVALTAVYGVLVYKIWAAERAAVQREVEAVSRVFSSYQVQLRTEVERYAASNAAYTNLSNRFSLEWAEARFGSEMESATDYSSVMLLRHDGQDVFLRTGQSSTQMIEKLSDSASLSRTFVGIQNEYQSLIRTHGNTLQSFTPYFERLSDVKIIEVGNSVAVAVSFAIVPDPGGIALADEPPYVLVTLHNMDAAHLDRLLKLLPLADLQFQKEPSPGKNGFALKNEVSEIVGYLVWPPMSQGKAIIQSSLLMVAFLTVAIFFATLFGLKRGRSGANLRA